MSDMKIKVNLEEANVNKDFFTSNRKENNLKCPFCQQELKPQTIGGEWLECWNCSYREPNSNHLPQPILCGSRELWQKLSDKIGQLETELECTRKALDVAVDALKKIKMSHNTESFYRATAELALEQITALEQKD